MLLVHILISTFQCHFGVKGYLEIYGQLSLLLGQHKKLVVNSKMTWCSSRRNRKHIVNHHGAKDMLPDPMFLIVTLVQVDKIQFPNFPVLTSLGHVTLRPASCSSDILVNNTWPRWPAPHLPRHGQCHAQHQQFSLPKRILNLYIRNCT